MIPTMRIATMMIPTMRIATMRITTMRIAKNSAKFTAQLSFLAVIVVIFVFVMYCFWRIFLFCFVCLLHHHPNIYLVFDFCFFDYGS